MPLLFIHKPHYSLLILSVLFIITGFIARFVLASSAIDIAIHDTYFVINFFHLSLAFSLIVMLESLPYLILEKLKRSPRLILTVIHYVSLLIFIGLFFYSIYFMVNAPTRSYYDDGIDTTILLFQIIEGALYVSICAPILNAFLSKKKK